MLRGAAPCCVVTFFLIRPRAAGWPVPPCVAPSEGVCPPAVHRKGFVWGRRSYRFDGLADSRPSRETIERLLSILHRSLRLGAGRWRIGPATGAWGLPVGGRNSKCASHSFRSSGFISARREVSIRTPPRGRSHRNLYAKWQASSARGSQTLWPLVRMTADADRCHLGGRPRLAPRPAWDLP